MDSINRIKLTFILAYYNVEDTQELLELIEDGELDEYRFDPEKALQHYEEAVHYESRIVELVDEIYFEAVNEDRYFEEYELSAI